MKPATRRPLDSSTEARAGAAVAAAALTTTTATTTDAGPQALTDVVLELFRTNGSLIAWGDQLVGPLDLTSARWQMLGAIALSTVPLTAPQLGEAMGVTRQGAQKQLNLLVDGGLVGQLPNPHHQRSPLYVLSPKGRALYARVDALWSRHARRLASGMRVRDLEIARRVLGALRTKLDGTEAGGIR